MGIFLDSPTFGGNLWARWGPIFTIELGSNTKKLTWRSLGRINIFNKDAEHYQFLEDFFLFKPSEHMEFGFQKLTWLPNDRSLVGYLASHRLFDITWLLLIPMLTDFQIFGSHCPTRPSSVRRLYLSSWSVSSLVQELILFLRFASGQNI